MKKYLLVNMIFVVYGCTLQIPDCKKSIDIDPFLKNKKELGLSEIASNIEYIKLETSPACLIGRIGKIVHFNNRFFVFDKQTQNILAFDSNGKFVNKIQCRLVKDLL